MIYRCNARKRRHGVVAPLVAVLMIFLLAMVAFAVDIGYVVQVRLELQNASDAAALAGTAKLLDPSLLQGSPNLNQAMTNARTEAEAFAVKNRAGGVLLTLVDNPANSPSGDVVCGFLTNPQDQNEVFDFTQFPNSVRVRLRRDSIQNGRLPLFFARFLGIGFEDLNASATATYQAGITGFRMVTPGSVNPKLLPFALDVVVWDNAPGRPWYDSHRPPGVVQGNGPDDFTRNPQTGAVTAGSDGIHECKLYPLSNGSSGNGNGGDLPPGNFGTVDIGSPNNSTADISRQILYGPNATDMAYFPGGLLGLDTTKSPPSMILEGDTGVSAGFKDDLASIIGQPRIIPLYLSVAGNGNNCQYTIVAFAGITITEVMLTGSLKDKHLTIQPCFVIEGNAKAGVQGFTSTFIYKPLSLTR